MVRQMRIFHLPLMVIPGPREPDTIIPHVEMVVKDFMNSQPGTAGIQTKRMDMHGHQGVARVEQKYTTHWPVLASWVADNPARQKVARMRGHAALRACGYCWIDGVHPQNKTVFLGYSSAVEIRQETVPLSAWSRMLQGQPRMCGASVSSVLVHVGDEVGQKTTAEMLEAGREVAAGNWDSTYGGCNGLSPVAELSYIDYKNIWVIGVAHIILLGLVPDFMNAVFPKISRGSNIASHVVSQKNRILIKKRHAAIHMPSGRPKPMCIVEKRSNFDMSHWWTHIK